VIRTVLRVAGMELRSALRDRQTVLYTVVLPLALYPAMFWIMLQAFSFIQGRDEVTEVRVELVAGESAVLEGLCETLRTPQSEELIPGPIELVPLPAPDPSSFDEQAARARLAAEDAPDAVLVLGAESTSIYHRSTDSRSELALKRIRQRLQRFAEDLRLAEVERSGADPARLVAFDVAPRDLASERDLGAYLLSFILPLTFVIMAVMGAFYPAVDSTAGEKERGTAETTLLLPVPRVAIQLGKVLAVSTGAFVATVLNLLGLALAAEHLLAGLDDVSIQIPWASLFAALPLCGAFLFTASAIMVALASFTETFKQGQSLLGAVQLFFIFPAVIAIMPGMSLTPGLALVPVVQTVLAFKALLQGVGSDATVSSGATALVFVSQVVYAGLAVWVSVRLTSREALQTSGASLRRIFDLWRTPGTPR